MQLLFMLVSLLQIPEILNPVKSQIVGIVRSVSTALAIIKSSTGNGNNVVILEKPVNVLKAMFHAIWMT